MKIMYGIIVLTLGLINAKSVLTETEYYPGLRKPPQSSNWPSVSNENAYLLAQLNSIIEEQARRRFQQQLQQQQQQQLQRGHTISEEISGPGFTYQLPVNDFSHHSGDSVPFAIGPSNPKYYEKHEKANAESSIYKNILDTEDEPVRSPSDGILSYKVKAPMDVNPKVIIGDDLGENFPSISKDVMTRDDLKKLVEDLQKNGQEDAIVNVYRNDVLKKHMELDAAMGMYVIALIAGVSAAVTVGLLAIGIGWYTLQKKAKAAADVEYPAYGVTGPNKDVSPSGDRRLAQSAQMYHYQHQKQQIIAMENQVANERNGSLSDVETDEENEEGDYTVYECPGLAPTGEMEVKNPLFLDDPTPVPKGTTIVTKPQQPSEAEAKSNDSPELSTKK